MIKVLIVDDEAIERQALSRIVSAQYTGQCTVYAASNGKEAIQMAEDERVDIILMDIEMPGINGLQAAQTIKQMLPRCRIIIITAYQRFQYAQQALSLGVEEYLLKPVANADLFRMLDKALEDIRQDRIDEKKRRALDHLAKEQFVLSVISGYSSPVSLHKQLRELSLSFSHGFCCVFASAGQESGATIFELLTPLIGQAEDIDALANVYDNTVICAMLLHSVYHNEGSIQQTVQAALDAVFESTAVRLYASIGRIVTDISELQRSYDQAAEMLSLCTPQHPVQILLDDLPHNRVHRGLERKLYSYLLEKDIDTAVRCVDTMLDTLFVALEQPEPVAHTAHQVLSRVADRLRNDARTTVDLAAALAPLEAMRLSQQEMSVRIRGVLVDWITALDAQPPDRMQRIRSEIERYIQSHYAQDLSIKQVAKAMHYSEPYFSKLFSRCFHRNFVTYLTDIRMQAAREMLGGSLASIREISLAVGFSDANYFAKVFRKTIGISPTEYRRIAYTEQDAPAAGGEGIQ